MENLETPISGSLPDAPVQDGEDLEAVGDAGDLPVADPADDEPTDRA